MGFRVLAERRPLRGAQVEVRLQHHRAERAVRVRRRVPYLGAGEYAMRLRIGQQLHVDIIAFQDGHVTYEELGPAMLLNKRLADKYGIELWTNSETFDRDMPIRFLPIKWEKLMIKLKAAESAGVTRALTFEFSHFMSPNSMYPSAHHLYDRYREYLKNGFPE